ncbi:N-acetyltransferase [Kitasatospora xanthocidica]|uniref:N-acetyltransferase n=1 Tax=Kitasatospora xanthocidica TaxID=83382 RepID=A0A372ZLL9_9ACTN|nr:MULTISPECIES: GNAT family N-acetyltransferase [Streptomycetaceae]OKH97193.1 GCN5 family acetyltransferase [Streptomyces sp. CB02056]RGD56763.1 N-acetyltransferase [Kitasatospora xanthocidica]
MIIDHWPLRGLRVSSPRLELRLPTEDELAEVADVAARGVHPPEERPFLTPWGELPPAERARHVVQLHWRRLGRWSAQDWALNLVAFHEGRPVGIQDMRAKEFGVRREIVSGSWLGLEFQGKGLGTEMRAAMLHLAFAELGTRSARSLSFADNHSSLAVSRRLGYRGDGIDRDVLDGRVVVSQRLRLTPEAWAGHARTPVTVTGLDEGCRALFGLDD